MLGYRPLVYFWVAEYTDGSSLPQFDPETGKENRFSEVDQTELARFGWYPFSLELAKKILETESVVVVPTKNQPYFVCLAPGDTLLACRTNSINLQMRNGGVEFAETMYVLGVKGKTACRINESGEIVN